MPVSVIDLPCAPPAATSGQTGTIVFERGNLRLRIEGQPDLVVLKLVLAQWFSQ
jgi:hypothetical protein